MIRVIISPVLDPVVSADMCRYNTPPLVRKGAWPLVPWGRMSLIGWNGKGERMGGALDYHPIRKGEGKWVGLQMVGTEKELKKRLIKN